MNNITYQDKIKFEAIQNTVVDFLSEKGYSVFNTTYEQLKDMVVTAKRQNKLNNYLLKNDSDDNVLVIECKDLQSEQLVKLGVRPSDKNSVKQLFIYQVLLSQYATLQSFKHFQNN